MYCSRMPNVYIMKAAKRKPVNISVKWWMLKASSFQAIRLMESKMPASNFYSIASATSRSISATALQRKNWVSKSTNNFSRYHRANLIAIPI